jgi:hypothetical protein
MPLFAGASILFFGFLFSSARSYAQSAMAPRIVGPLPATRTEAAPSSRAGTLSSSDPDGRATCCGLPDFREEASVTGRPWQGTFPAVGQSTAQSGNRQDQPRSQTDQKKSTPSATGGSEDHMYWVVPAFKVDFNGQFKPLSPKEKFKEWAQGVYDPLGLGVTAFEAGTLEYRSADGFCGYGHGWGPYGQCFGSLEADSTISSFIGDYALAVWWHQDPRYFRLGKGSVGKRVFYAISRVFVAYNDSGHTVFNSSALSGTVIAAGISNLYAPQQDRGVSNSISRAGLDLSNTAIFNTSAEFWPDIHRWVRRIF